ncbi:MULTISPECIES: adenosine deaminase [unclassified Streptomyces]|uniref:adenosine deaminase family protein n=1 Tax=unclassified Streptomyces TaxID=2593676 RepID=UPI0036EF52C1
MIPHLHLHLEPEERKRRAVGLPSRRPRSSAAFFDAHRVDTPDRVRVSGHDLGRFLRDVHAEHEAQGVDYVEVRVSPRRFLTDGLSLDDVLGITHRVLDGLRGPYVRAVLLLNRDCPDETLEECAAALTRLPSTFVGVDIAGDERRHPDVDRFQAFCSAARSAGRGVTVHAGEFGSDRHIWSALDRLGAQRIGHGIAAASSKTLMDRLARDHVHVEVSLTSNAALGAVRDIEAHPVRTLIEHGVSVSFNADVPLHTGRSFRAEISTAAEVLRCTTSEVLALQKRALPYCFTEFPLD